MRKGLLYAWEVGSCAFLTRVYLPYEKVNISNYGPRRQVPCCVEGGRLGMNSGVEAAVREHVALGLGSCALLCRGGET